MKIIVFKIHIFILLINYLANTRGGLFAGATAGSGVGASASLAGDTNNGVGSFGVGQAEAHAGGVQKEVIKTVSTSGSTGIESNVANSVDVGEQSVEVETPAIPNTSSLSITQTETEIETDQNNPSIVQTEQIEEITQSIIQSTTTLTPQTTVNNPS